MTNDEAARSHQSLTRAIAHDMLQPLSAIGIQLTVLREQSGNRDKLHQSIDTLATAFNALQSQIDELHCQCGFPPVFTARPVRVGILVAQTVRLYQPMAAQTGVRLAFRPYQRTSEATKFCDPSYGMTVSGPLTTALQSLISNALDHGTARTHRLAVPPWALVGISKAGGVLTIRVCDNGPGIPSPVQARIFEAGFRAAHPTGSAGSGLGLYNAHRLITALPGHSISDSSRAGSATCFKIRLPAVRLPSK